MMYKDAEEYGRAIQMNIARQRLERAAPALLEALENVLIVWDKIYPCMKSQGFSQEQLEDFEFNEILKARAAIAAAKGE